MRRLERLKVQVTADWHQRTALNLMLMLWSFLRDLTDREVLILWEGSAMDRAMQRLMPMCRHGLKANKSSEAREQASALLARLQGEGLYR